MNLFTEIKWSNLTQRGFLDDDHIRENSFTYKFLADKLKVSKHLKRKRNPVDDECSESGSEKRAPVADEDGSPSRRKGRVDLDEPVDESDCKRRINKYIAGLVGGLPFPKKSSLTKQEQATFIQLHSKFSANNRATQGGNISAEDQRLLATYIELNVKVMAERAEYLAFLKGYWRIQSIKFNRLPTLIEQYSNESRRHRIESRLSSYPRYYNRTKTIPLVDQGEKNDVTLVPGDILLQLGSAPAIMQPTFKMKIQLSQDAVKVSKRYPPDGKQPDVDTKNTIYKLPVSEDVNASQLAMAYGADVVISSAGLKAVANNHADFGRPWDVPVVVKRYEPRTSSDPARTVVYVDKPLPPRCQTVAGMSERYHKLAVKTLWCHPRHPQAFSFQPQRDGAANNKPGTADAKVETDVDQVKAESGGPFVGPAPHDNVSYRLWTMRRLKGSKEELPRHMMKQATGVPDRELRVLVRNKMDGLVGVRRNEARVPVAVLPKLEHQSEFGAEKMTKTELTNEWLALKFREGARLTRVRVNAETSEALLTEHVTLEALTQGAKQSHGPDFVSDVTSTLYSVLSGLVDLSPGNYLLTHSASMQAFALLQKGNKDFGSFDLQQTYSKVESDEIAHEEMPWVEVDTSFPMPYHFVFNRVPGTFYPVNVVKPAAVAAPTRSHVSPTQPRKKVGGKKKKNRNNNKRAAERAAMKGKK